MTAQQPWVTGPTQPSYRKRSVASRLSAVLCAAALAVGFVTTEAQALLKADPAAEVVTNTPPMGPPPVRISTHSLTLALQPYTSCWSSGQVGMCYDGIPSKPLPSVGGTAGPVTLAFAVDKWRFHLGVEDRNGNRTRVELVKTNPRHWRLALGTFADGHYRADVFGRGPEGDVAAAFAFTLK